MALTDIKRISIREYLGAMGIKPQRERGNRAMYLSPLRRETTASFSVNFDENVWYDHGLGEGGSIIDLVARMENCSVGEAIRRLENDTLGNAIPLNIERGQRNVPERPLIEIVSVGELKHPALVDYLRERCIDLTAARKYCHEVRYSIGGREYFAIGFRNDAGGWELRNRSFKGSSTPKNITTIRGGRGGDTMIDTSTGIATASDTVMVFEGFIDLLSYLSLKQNSSPTIDTAVLNSVANLRRTIPFLESHHTVHTFLDNDEAGRKTLNDLRESLPGSEIVDQSAFYRNHKDLNDYWREQAAPKPRVEETNAADTVKRQTPTSDHTSADKFRRSIPAVPVKKRGRGV